MKKLLYKSAAFLMAGAIGLGGLVPVYGEENADNADFDEFLTQEFVEAMESDYMSMHFAVKDYESYGIEKPDLTIGDASKESYDDAKQSAEESLKKLKAFDYDSLSDRQKTDYDTYKASLQETIDLNSYPMLDSLFNSSSGIINNLLTNFTEFVFYRQEDVDDYLAVLATVPDYIDQALELTKQQAAQGFFLSDSQLDDTESDISKFTEKTDDNQLIVIFDEAMDAADFLTDEQRADYKAKNRDLVLSSYIPAYAKAGEELEKLRGSANYEGGLCNYSNGGKEYYEALARSKSSTSLSVQEQFDFLNSFISDQVTEMINLYRKDPNIYDEFDSETVDVTSPEDILNQLQNNLQDYPAGPDVTYTASYLDPSVANDSIMAYYVNPPIDDPTDNVIKINGSNISDTNELYGTLAHEGFPGHLYQTTWFLNTNPNPIHAAISEIGYTEGWAMYAEVNQFAHSSLSANVAEMQKINTTLGYTMDAAADLAVNGLGYTVEDLADWLDQLGLNSDSAQSLYDFVVSQPGVILPYGYGMAKFLTYQQEAEDALGSSYDAVEFNTVLLTGGARTFEQLDKDVENYIKGSTGTSTAGAADGGNSNSSTSGGSSFLERYGVDILIGVAVAIAILAFIAQRSYHRDDPFGD